MMATLSNLIPNQILYDYFSRRMGNTTLREEVCVPVRVIEIDLSTKRALCSRYGNSPRWVSEREIKRYRVNKKVK